MYIKIIQNVFLDNNLENFENLVNLEKSCPFLKIILCFYNFY